MGQTDEERSWIERSLNGDHEAFAALIVQYEHMIHSVTFRMTGSPADAADLAQETFIQAFRRLNTFRGESRFSSWLCQIAVNACSNWRKSDARRMQAHREWTEHQLILSGQIERMSAADEEATIRVQGALLKLPPKQRAAIILTVYEGMNHAEAARVLGCSETTVSWRLFAARTRLKRLLKGIR